MSILSAVIVVLLAYMAGTTLTTVAYEKSCDGYKMAVAVTVLIALVALLVLVGVKIGGAV